MGWIGSREHQFNVGNKEKCPHCGLYFMSAHIDSHMSTCLKNPANQESDDEE